MSAPEAENRYRRHNLTKPPWLKIKLPDLAKASQMLDLLGRRHLNTICSSGMCPNRAECWSAKTATFMICGNICTRSCKFCAVATGNPHGVIDDGEILQILESIEELKLRHIVLTSVDRDDLPDGGAAHWAKLVKNIREKFPDVTIETLIPDFRGNKEAIDMVVSAGPHVISHNMETVRRLTPLVRSVATYDGSLEVLKYISQCGKRTKSGLMLGLGETDAEVLEAMDDLIEVGCNVLTLGQYLQPSSAHYPVHRYVSPDDFEKFKLEGLKRGFLFVESSPFVRSSYHAHHHASGL